MTLAEILEKLLVSERPVVEGAGFYAFEFIGDNGAPVHIYVRRDYSNSEFGVWVIDGTVYLPY